MQLSQVLPLRSILRYGFKEQSVSFGCWHFSSATHDVGADGFYMMGLNQHDQAFFVGIRSTFYRISMVVGKGGLIAVAGFLHQQFNIQITWMLVFYGLMALFIGLALYHFLFFPDQRKILIRKRFQPANS